MNAIVTAGGIPKPGEPLYPYTKGKAKAMLDIAGKPMIQWVLDALEAARHVDSVVIVGRTEDLRVQGNKISTLLPSAGGMLENIRSGVKEVVKLDPSTHHTLLVSSDIPAITGESVDWAIEAAMQTEHDVYYNVITRQVMEARYPASKRSYTHLRDIEICGGDLNVIRPTTVSTNNKMWQRIIAARKNVFKQAALIGYDTLILLLLRAITLEQAVNMVKKRLKVTGRVIICPYADIGMDVDKPHQYEIMLANLK